MNQIYCVLKCTMRFMQRAVGWHLLDPSWHSSVSKHPFDPIPLPSYPAGHSQSYEFSPRGMQVAIGWHLVSPLHIVFFLSLLEFSRPGKIYFKSSKSKSVRRSRADWPSAQKFNTHLRISVYYVFTRGPILENLKNAIILTFSNLRFAKPAGIYIT